MFPCSILPTGDLESFKDESFVLKEGVEYKIKISFKVSTVYTAWHEYTMAWLLLVPLWLCL